MTVGYSNGDGGQNVEREIAPDPNKVNHWLNRVR